MRGEMTGKKRHFGGSSNRESGNFFRFPAQTYACDDVWPFLCDVESWNAEEAEACEKKEERGMRKTRYEV